ncbi:MAG: hypothetical protein K2O70_00705 [Desulfovibrionaceae bacterium]|nr:hypothetical protein [Desulfovibrionaceae bacterium]
MSASHHISPEPVPHRRGRSLRLAALCVPLLCLLLAGCLVPDKYHAVLSLSNPGYSLEYIGEMHMAAAYSETYRRSIDSDPQKLARTVMREFARVVRERPQGQVEIQPVSDTTFRTKFSYVSPYNLPEASGMFKLSVDGDTLTVVSRPMSAKDKEFLRLNDITSKGKLCIKAFGTVLETNAQRTATILNRCNEWDMDNLDTPIKLVVKFSKPIPNPPAPQQ